ncbi:MAG: DUF4286 family protein [Gammaproteobacteria bacterium]
MKIIYEVTIHIDTGIADEYDAWLAEHVVEMLTLPGFLSAETFVIENNEKSPTETDRVVHYQLENRAAFDAYLRDHAERMRNEGLARFSYHVTASRRILKLI